MTSTCENGFNAMTLKKSIGLKTCLGTGEGRDSHCFLSVEGRVHQEAFGLKGFNLHLLQIPFVILLKSECLSWKYIQ